MCELALVPDLMCPLLVQDVVHEEEALRQAAADALAAAVNSHPEHVHQCMLELRELYEDKLYVSVPVNSLVHSFKALSPIGEQSSNSYTFPPRTFTEGLMTEFECVTVSYGIECSFLVIITHECA